MALRNAGPKTKQPLWAAAYDAVYRRIITLEFEPGQRLEETVLVDQLGIGRTPIREALLHLAADLLVESQPGKGYIVRPITLQNTKAAFAALKIMELGVADLALGHDISGHLDRLESINRSVADAIKQKNVLDLVEVNSRFHLEFASCSRNMYLVEGLRRVRCEANRLAYLSYGNEIDPHRSLKIHYDSVLRQHNEIIGHLRKREAAPLKEIIEAHLQIFKNRIISYLTS